jgi:hypothetical protein
LGKKEEGEICIYNSELLKKILEGEEDEEEDEDDYYIYQPLVYPPNSTPPTPNLSKKINFVDFNRIL